MLPIGLPREILMKGHPKDKIDNPDYAYEADGNSNIFIPRWFLNF